MAITVCKCYQKTVSIYFLNKPSQHKFTHTNAYIIQHRYGTVFISETLLLWVQIPLFTSKGFYSQVSTDQLRSYLWASMRAARRILPIFIFISWRQQISRCHLQGKYENWLRTFQEYSTKKDEHRKRQTNIAFTCTRYRKLRMQKKTSQLS